MPAARAAAMPGRESSNTNDSSGGTPSRELAARNPSGSGLPRLTSSREITMSTPSRGYPALASIASISSRWLPLTSAFATGRPSSPSRPVAIRTGWLSSQASFVWKSSGHASAGLIAIPYRPRSAARVSGQANP